VPEIAACGFGALACAGREDSSVSKFSRKSRTAHRRCATPRNWRTVSNLFEMVREFLSPLRLN
jgi:uncharacterized protein (DUF1697 family)